MSTPERLPPLPDNRPESRPVRLLARLTSGIWWLLLIILVLLALYAGIGRQLTQNVDAFRDDLASELSERLGHDVSIGSLSSRWYWLDPAFTAENIEITNSDSGVQILNLQHLTIRLDALASLLRLRVVFEDFQADGLDITLNQKNSGELGIRGAEFPEPVSNRLRYWLEVAGKWLSEPYIKVTRINLGLRDNEGHLRHLDIPQLDLLYQQGLLRASGRAMESGTTRQLASFALVGKHIFRGEFSGQAYLNVDSGRLFDGLIDEYQWRDVRVQGFDLGGEAWLTFRDGIMQQVSGTVTTPYLQLGVENQSLAPLEDIRARFGWRRHRTVMEEETQGDQPATIGEWHLSDLTWNWNDHRMPAFSLKVLPGPERVSVSADAVSLQPLRQLVSRLGLLPPVAGDALEDYRPVGFLDDVNVQIPGRGDRSFEFSARLRNVGAAAYNGAPAASGVNGFIYTDQNAGYVRARAGEQPVTLAFPELFSSEWSLPELSARVAWRLNGPVTRVYADDIRLRYGDDTRLNGAFDLRLEQQGEDNLSLRVGVENGSASMIADFVPEKVVDAGLYDWLTTAVTDGEVPAGAYYGHGQIGRDAPSGSFVSSMWYEFSNGTVRYDPEWPEVTRAHGRVAIQNGDTRVSLESGETGGLTLDPGTVTVTPGDEGALVEIDVSAPVTGSALGWWMANSPLGSMAGPRVAALDYGGDYALDLNIDLPLNTSDEVVVEAGVATENGALGYPEADLRWEGINGSLSYHTKNGFSGGPLQARFLQEPVEVSFSQVSEEGSGAGLLSLRQTGSLSVPRALRQSGLAGAGADSSANSDDSLYGLEGRIDYSAVLDVPADSKPRLTVSSGLEGLSIDWPGPFSKKAAESAPLVAQVDPEAEAGLAIAGRWEDRASFDLQFNPSGVELTFSELHLGQQTLQNLHLEALDLGDRWVVRTQSERAAGRVMIPDDNGTITADFEVLRLLRTSDPAEDTPELLTIEQQLDAFRALDMVNWPNVDVSISELRLNSDNLGRWSFRLRPQHQQLNVTDIQGRVDSLTLLGDMTWSVVNNRETSQFSGTLSGGGLSDLDGLFGTEIPLSNKQSHIELDLDWPGRPDDFALKDLSGSVSVRLDDGVILKSNNSAQLFRIFNLLNADTLWRRLKLDFSDLYERGVAFDAISGKANLEDGLLTLDPELQVVGPSGAFKLSGQTSLAREDLDMRLVVVLPLTQNLPLAALLMGAGAPIGGALFVLDKVLGDPLSKLTSATYNVTGTWADPKVDLKGVFDTGD